MAIIFTKNLSVSNDTIDHDHHFIINFINTIELLLKKKEESKYLIVVLDQLYEFTEQHFRREEVIQRKIEYPKSIKHRGEHSNLLSELRNLGEEFKNAKSDEEIHSRTDDIVVFLRNWIINHVINEDLLLKPYLEKHPKSLY